LEYNNLVIKGFILGDNKTVIRDKIEKIKKFQDLLKKIYFPFKKNNLNIEFLALNNLQNTGYY